MLADHCISLPIIWRRMHGGLPLHSMCDQLARSLRVAVWSEQPLWMDSRLEHPERHFPSYMGILQADTYSGYKPRCSRGQGPITPASMPEPARRLVLSWGRLPANAGKEPPADLAHLTSGGEPALTRCAHRACQPNGLSIEDHLLVRQEQSRRLVDSGSLAAQHERVRSP